MTLSSADRSFLKIDVSRCTRNQINNRFKKYARDQVLTSEGDRAESRAARAIATAQIHLSLTAPAATPSQYRDALIAHFNATP